MLRFPTWRSHRSLNKGPVNGSSAKPRRRFHGCGELLEQRQLLAVTMLKDIDGAPGGWSEPYFLTHVIGTLFFTANDGAHGDELWKSDGTPNGTTLVKDIKPGPDGTYPSYLTAVGNSLFFMIQNEEGNGELWKSDGSEGGTIRVMDFGPDSQYYYPQNLTAVGNTLFFTNGDEAAGTELWQSDGTAAGTKLVKDIAPGTDDYGYPYGSYPYYLTSAGGTLYFTADDGLTGTELWKSDGTAAGTVRVKDIAPGLDDYGYPYGSYPYELTSAGGTLYFTANDGVSGAELWKSDGTLAGTMLVKDIAPGNDDYGYPNSSDPSILMNVGDTLYLIADDGVHGFELWKSDGTAAGTVLVKDIAPGSDGIYSVNEFADLDGMFYFFVDGGRGGLDELWKSDGTEDGTTWVADAQPRIAGRYGSEPGRQPTALDGTLYFVASIGPAPPPPCPHCARPPGNSELWSSDGTEEGTLPVAEINPSEYGSFPSGLTRIGGMLFFSANDAVHGEELWVFTSDVVDVPGDTDGDGDVDITDLNNVRNNFGASGPSVLGDTLPFDGDVDVGDLDAVRNHFGESAPAMHDQSSSIRNDASDGGRPLEVSVPQPAVTTARMATDLLFGSWEQTIQLASINGKTFRRPRIY